MNSVQATFRNGRVELAQEVNWRDGTQLEVSPLNDEGSAGAPMTQWPEGFFDRLRHEWGEEPFERPPQGEFESREAW